MKTKLTLTIKESVIAKAKRYSRKTGKSLSRIFEELFENIDTPEIKSESQRAAERLLKRLEQAESVETLNDKQLLKAHVLRKFA